MTEIDIRGISSATKDLTSPGKLESPCKGNYNVGSPPVGYMMHTTLNRNYDTPRLNRGARLRDVHFSLFDQPDDDECSGSVPIAFNTNDKRDGHWDYLSSFKNVTVDGIKMIDAKAADENGVSDIVISDPDGSSDPFGLNTGPGSFVSNKLHLTEFAGGDCSVHDDDIAYCENTCYRTVQLRVSSIGEFSLRVTREDDGSEVLVPDIFLYDDDGTNRASYFDHYRTYSVSLPAGAFKLEFFDNDGVPSWPRYVYEIWEGIPDCEGYGSVQDVTIVEPELDCNDMIMNGNMEEGTYGWLHNNDSGNTFWGYLEALPNIGIGGSTALAYYNRKTKYMGVSQDLDTRCFHQNLNAYYEVKAWFRLEQGGEVFICDPFFEWYGAGYPSRCPLMTLRTVKYLNPTTKDDLQWETNQYIAKVVTPHASPEFNLLHGVIEIDEDFNAIQRAFLYIEHFAADLDIIVDDFSITKLDTGCSTTSNLIRNADFSAGDTRFWSIKGTAKFDEVDQTLKLYNAIEHYIHIDRECLNVGDRYLVHVRYRLEDSDENTFECNMQANDITKCPYMKILPWIQGPSWDAAGTVGKNMPIHPVVSDGWAMLTGIFTLDEADANYDSMYARIEGSDSAATIVLNDVSVEPLPKICDQIIVNPSFDDGSAFAWNRNVGSLDVSVVEAGENGNYALKFAHNQGHKILFQDLDTRCFVDGQEFLFTAKFQLLNASDEQPVDCDRSVRE